MSTFLGKIQEIPGITVDRFDIEYKNFQAYFLSHCHTDHMIGIDDAFWEHLEKNNKFLYASEISCAILTQDSERRSINVKKLCLDAPTTISLTDKDLVVAVIPAEHCLGSVMFLFETKANRILYTGDYRINISDFKNCRALYNSSGVLKDFDKMYLDTTFFLKKYRKFPKREESSKEICRIIDEYLKIDEHCQINLITGGFYGCEFLFKEIYSQLKMPVHIQKPHYDIYKLLPEFALAVTEDCSKTEIHCHCGGYKKICRTCTKDLIINSTALSWTSKKVIEKNGFSCSYNNRRHSVCYSEHPSLDESIELIRFIRPRNIEANVRRTDIENAEMDAIIQDELRQLHGPAC